MIRESEIGNFLDLIKHIAEAKDLPRAQPRIKSQYRYQRQPENETDTHDSIIPEHLRGQGYNPKARNLRAKKTNHRSFQLEDFPPSQAGLVRNNSKERKNLYDLYCEDLHKKREEKTKANARQQKEVSLLQNWEDSIAASLERSQGPRSLHRERSMPPISKPKGFKTGLDNPRLRKSEDKNRTAKSSGKKLQPSELSIGTIG